MHITRYDQGHELREIGGDWQGWLYAHGFLRIRLVPVLRSWHRLMLQVWKAADGREFVVFKPAIEASAIGEQLWTAIPDSDTLEAFLRATRHDLKAVLAHVPAAAGGYVHS